MLIKNINLSCFRNYAYASADFFDGVNVIFGSNAQGKTNLIEAIYYIAAGRSFRSVSDKEMISLGEDFSEIRTDILSGGREQSLQAKLSRVKRREFYANGVKLKKTSELYGRFSVVLFNPDDLDMIKDGAVIRRRLMDACISQLRPRYALALTEYNRIHEQKTRILKNHIEKPSLLEMLDDYNHRMAQLGALLIYYRCAFSAILSKRAEVIHNEFSGGKEILELKYRTVGGFDAAGKKPEQILPILLEHHEKHRSAELRSGLCLSGAHKDDIEIFINGRLARKYASQGQARTASVSIKLAERDIHYDDRGEYPVLLLDDVLSELDTQRQGFILKRIPNGQVFITCCDDTHIKAIGGAVFLVKNGVITQKH